MITHEAPRGQKYRKFQIPGIRFLADRTSALLADEPGLGKTIQAIGAMNEVKAKSALIVCPASVKYNWPKELRNWLLDYKTIQVLEGRSAHVDTDAEVIIVNYDLLSASEALVAQLKRRRFDVGVFDEAHYLKSHTSNRTKAVLLRGGIASLCKQKWFLTGTPVLNRPIELYPILKAAASETIAPYLTRLDFAKQFCGAWWDGLQWVIDGSSNEAELNERLHKTFMLRRLKSQVLKDLPEKCYKIVPISKTGALKKVLEQEKETLEQLEADNVNLMLCGDSITTHRREVAEAKVAQCVEYIREELESVEKIVVFAHHKSVIAAISAGLIQYNPVAVTGDTPSSNRALAVHEFQTLSERRVFIGQIQAAGTGITLTAASDVIFVESSWVPGEILQAADRLHRIGQKNAVTVTFLVAQDSVEEYMIRRVVDKLKTINQIVEKPGESE
jgi:SWI/SNF-related matrix-associated actin-dependent regulator 1 of chromatin subfamily A